MRAPVDVVSSLVICSSTHSIVGSIPFVGNHIERYTAKSKSIHYIRKATHSHSSVDPEFIYNRKPFHSTRSGQFIYTRLVYTFTLNLHFHLWRTNRSIYSNELICVQTESSIQLIVEMKIR